jgi:plasmid stability protein
MATLSQITVRNVDADLKQRLHRSAQKKNMSVNSYMLDIARRAVGSGTVSTWRKYEGALSSDAINPQTLDDFETIDTSMWR